MGAEAPAAASEFKLMSDMLIKPMLNDVGIFRILVASALLFGAGPSLRAHSGGVSPEFVDSLLSEYLEIQNALSEGDLHTARDHGKNLSKSFNRGPSERAHSKFSEIRRAAHRIGKSQQLFAARSEFSKLSVGIAAALEDLERNESLDLFLFRCDAAQDGQGAVWVQQERTASSPYGCSPTSCEATLDRVTNTHG